MRAEIARLREQRNAIVSQMNALIRAAETANRGFSPAEDKEWEQLKGKIDDIDARMQRTELLNDYARPMPSAGSILIDGGRSSRPADGEWRNAETGAAIRVLEPNQPVSVTAPVPGDLTLGDFARAMVAGPRTDVERRALSEGTLTAGGHLVPTPLSNEVIDRLRAATVVFRAGARTVLMDSQTLKIARVTGDSTASWLAEAASMSGSDPTFGSVTLTAKTLRCLVIASREVVEDAPNFDEVLSNMLARAFAVELDRAALLGSGSGAEPQGLVNQSGTGSVTNGANGAVLANYDQYVNAVQAVMDANAAPPTGWVLAPRTVAQFGKFKDTTNQPLVPPAMVANIPQYVTTSIPVTQTVGTSTDCSTVFVGDWRQMLVGIRTGFTLRVLQERYADNYQIGFLASLRADVQLALPAAFAKITGIRA